MQVNQRGFTLIELLTVVVIISILTAIALPNYRDSVEKSRATEAMGLVKAANEAVYSYSSERGGTCPASFDKLIVNIPGERSAGGTVISTKYFDYKLNAATNAPVPGSNCGGVVAERKSVGYKIWNPNTIINASTKKRGLACTGTGRAKDICETLKMYTTSTPY